MAFTFFFRDAQTLQTLVEAAVPALRGQAFIRIWDAGCAHGPEPFTLAMMLRERMSDFLFHNVTIHATDVDPSFAASLASGVFAEQEVRRMPRGLLARYFEPGPSPGTFRVVEEVRRRVTFERHDLLSLVPVRHELSMIVCKNVLLHFEEPDRVDVLRMFHAALRADGLLAMEHTQKLPEELAGHFHPLAPHVQVYRKHAGAHPHLPAPARTRLEQWMRAEAGT